MKGAERGIADNVPFVIQMVGYSNSGKTTLVEKLIVRLQEKGRCVGVIKHDGHDFEMDHPGTDTWRFQRAGAPLVAIQSKAKTAWLERKSVPLPELLRRMGEAGADIVLVEGFKQADYPKIAVLRREEEMPLLRELKGLVGIVCWFSLEYGELPVFSIDDVDAITSFLYQLAAFGER